MTHQMTKEERARHHRDRMERRVQEATNEIGEAAKAKALRLAEKLEAQEKLKEAEQKFSEANEHYKALEYMIAHKGEHPEGEMQ